MNITPRIDEIMAKQHSTAAKYNISLIRSEFFAYLCAPLRLNFQPQFAMILRKSVLSHRPLATLPEP
ncbi:MAG: hypothetical protein KME59_09150 [Trichormus sp. ATA11-4-KO1]|jgi:hypothetical protein|nr:hypothetical protein [Trichormus sp. ATA11-4-KO1]